MALYDLMSYLIPFYDLPLVSSPYVCLILTPWMYDSQNTPVVPLCLLISGTKYSHTLLLNLTFFDFFIILFDWDEYHDQVSKILKDTSLCSPCNEISYHVICGAPFYIQFLLTDTVRYEKETNVDVLGVIAT